MKSLSDTLTLTSKSTFNVITWNIRATIIFSIVPPLASFIISVLSNSATESLIYNNEPHNLRYTHPKLPMYSKLFYAMLLWWFPAFLQLTFRSCTSIAAIKFFKSRCMFLLQIQPAACELQPSIWKSYLFSIRALPKYLTTLVLFSTVVGVGMLLVIVPGAILLIWYEFSTYVAVLENVWCFSAMSRSRNYTFGTRKMLLWINLCFGLCSLLIIGPLILLQKLEYFYLIDAILRLVQGFGIFFQNIFYFLLYLVLKDFHDGHAQNNSTVKVISKVEVTYNNETKVLQNVLSISVRDCCLLFHIIQDLRAKISGAYQLAAGVSMKIQEQDMTTIDTDDELFAAEGKSAFIVIVQR